MDNLLKITKIKKELKKNNLKSNEEAINEIDKLVKKQIKELLEVLRYLMEIKGRKVITKKDVLEAISKLEKKDDFFDDF